MNQYNISSIVQVCITKESLGLHEKKISNVELCSNPISELLVFLHGK